ncbi:MAG: hypothetical protein ACYTEV_05850 [Planctomycetota bacterium]
MSEIHWPARRRLEVAAVPGPADGPVLNRHPWVARSAVPWVATLREERLRIRWSRATAAGTAVVRSVAAAGSEAARAGDAESSEAGRLPDRGPWAGGSEASPSSPQSPQRLVSVSSWTLESPESLAAFPEPEPCRRRAAAPVPPGVVLDPHWGVRMRYLPPPADAGPARGVLVHLHGLGGHRLERHVQPVLRRAGWGVLECVYPLAGWSRLAADASDPEQVRAAGATMAAIIDDRFAELAIAAEAAIETLAAEGDEAAAAGPLLVAGFSAGGNAAPAVAARLAGRVRAMSIVMAGADLMEITIASTLGDTGFDGVRDGRSVDRRRLTAAERRRFSEAYLERVRLDGFAVGPHLAGVPVLLVPARFDRVVPAAASRRLGERLGGSEVRWLPTGHVGGYLSLPWTGPRIGRWLLRAAGG